MKEFTRLPYTGLLYWVGSHLKIKTRLTNEKFVYYESIKREPKIRGIYDECRCDERLQTKSKEFTRLAYTEFIMKR